MLWTAAVILAAVVGFLVAMTLISSLYNAGYRQGGRDCEAWYEDEERTPWDT